MNISTELPSNHWLHSYPLKTNNDYLPDKANYSILYSVYSNIPSNCKSLHNLDYYAGALSCMGYPLDLACRLNNIEKVTYSHAGLNGLSPNIDLTKDYDIAICLPFYEPAVHALIEAANNWQFQINEMYHINNHITFTGKTKDWFITKWKLQALLHLYRITYNGSLKRAGSASYMRDLNELKSKFIPNVAPLFLYDVENIITMLKYLKTPLSTFLNNAINNKINQERYNYDSHYYGICEFAPYILEYVTNNFIKKITTGMYLKIRSRHPSHECLRRTIRTGNKRIVFRLGSTTNVPNVDHEFNTAIAVQNSANKGLMKTKFAEHNVRTAKYIFPTNETQLTEWISNNNYNDKKLIIKSLTGSRGRGLYLKQNGQEAIEWFRSHGYGHHIIEKYYNYNREYRLHVSKNGCFYTNRKILRKNAQERWYRNNSNCVWILEENPAFNKPSNWQTIIDECVKALNAVGLDIGACDVRVASSNEDFIICEINSAPSFGELTAKKYEAELNRLIQQLD